MNVLDVLHKAGELSQSSSLCTALSIVLAPMGM